MKTKKRLVAVALVTAMLGLVPTGSADETPQTEPQPEPPWGDPLGTSITCGGREYIAVTAAGSPGSNYYVQVWEERQSAVAYANNDFIWVLVTYNKQYPTWRSGVSMEIESTYVHPYTPWGNVYKSKDFDSTDDAHDGCAGIFMESAGSRTRVADLSIRYYFSGLERTTSTQAGYSWSLGASVAYTHTWEVSGSTTPPSASGSVGGALTFGLSASYATEESNSVTFTSTNQVGLIGWQLGGPV